MTKMRTDIKGPETTSAPNSRFQLGSIPEATAQVSGSAIHLTMSDYPHRRDHAVIGYPCSYLFSAYGIFGLLVSRI